MKAIRTSWGRFVPLEKEEEYKAELIERVEDNWIFNDREYITKRKWYTRKIAHGVQYIYKIFVTNEKGWKYTRSERYSIITIF